MSASSGLEVVGTAVGRPGRFVLGIVGELGATGLLALSALRSLARPSVEASGLAGSVARQAGWMIGAGLPLVALVHVGVGSFLSMQAFFGATFPEGTGAVVGVGLIRNLAPLMSGMILAGMLSSRLVAELRCPSRVGLDDDPCWVPDRESRRLGRSETRPEPDPARLAGTRILGAAVAGPVLGLWGAIVGILVGWQVAQAMLGISTGTYFLRFTAMLWVKDVISLAAKGALFGALAALFACVEGLRGEALAVPRPADLVALQAASLRATCRACLLILFLNSAWFLVFYMGGDPFGPRFD